MKAIKSLILLLFLVDSLSMSAQKMQDTCVHMHEIVVTGLTGATHIHHIPSPVSVVAHDELQGIPSTNIIDAIAKHPGISQITTGGGISKPVIRGLGYNRVLTVSDGLRQEGQQWGNEHGVEVDGESVYSVEVMKGPASLMYGSDAMAGVVVFHDAPILPQDTMTANASAGWQSNGNLWNYSVRFAGNEKGFVWDGRWSQRHAGEYENRHNGKVENSQFAEQAAKLMMGWNKRWGYSHLKFSYYHLKPGIIETPSNSLGSPSNSPCLGGGLGSLPMQGGRGEGLLSPYQHIHHFKAMLDNSLSLGDGGLKLLVGYQQNRRQEYEEPDECGLDFRLHTVNYDVRYVSPEWSGWTMNVGVGGMWQQSQNLGTEFLIPAYHLFDIGAFVTMSRDFDERLHLSGGLRLDNRHLNSHSLVDEGEERFKAFKRNFTGLTGSLGMIYNVTPRLDIRLNVARGFRAPNLSELGSNGVHHGTTRYELGAQSLDPETSWQFDLGFDYSTEVFSANLALFLNRINDYIFMEKTGDVIGDHDVFSYRQGNARLMGFEATVILHPIELLHFENSFSYVDARQMNQPDEAKYLPFTPAPRWLSSLHYHVPLRTNRVKNLFAEVEMDCNLAQNHVHTAYDTETRTPSYTLWNASIGGDIFVRRGSGGGSAEPFRLLSLSLFAQNIFDRAYQNHLSRLKEADIYNAGRNIGVKVTATF